jgi:hypothetical protein
MKSEIGSSFNSNDEKSRKNSFKLPTILKFNLERYSYPSKSADKSILSVKSNQSTERWVSIDESKKKIINRFNKSHT